MVLNIGYIELGGTDVDVKIYYDVNWQINNPTADPDLAPLVDGPRGFCLDLTNSTGKPVKVTVFGISNNPQVFNVGKGDPVTTGQARSMTAAQLASAGYTTRGNVGTVSLE